jgi:hypothetical protein
VAWPAFAQSPTLASVAAFSAVDVSSLRELDLTHTDVTTLVGLGRSAMLA